MVVVDYNNLIPICFIILLGAILKKMHFIDNAFIEKAIDLMHFVLLPIVIFWTIAENKNCVDFGWDVYLTALFSTFMGVFVGLLYIFFFRIEKAKALVFSMSCYRSNVYLGLTLIYYLFDKNVFSKFCVILFMIIPMVDVMTKISTLWIFKNKKKRTAIVRPIVRLILSNPIVIAGVLGILLSKKNTPPPVFLTEFFNLIYPTIFPLALILTGAVLSQTRIKNYSILTVAGSISKTIILPFSGCLLIYLFSDRSEMFDAIIVFLSLPYMLDRKICSTTDNIQRKVIMPFYSMSALFSFLMISVILYLLPK